ncbi:class I SAM-dependent methyltransferase [Mesorhizobium koreense]|uniref:class I SAM-dependent methyltransferase n=1 Tax=Mesorhizobium koreense TaxID=3074855 RepID=UPI00287B7E89|nr:class I SAM-dependent methyltransferase [Mesorhizobium sp. WR6]
MPTPLHEFPFADAAQYYDRFRAPYPKAALDFIVEAFALSEKVRALDLGCGPGTIAIPLSYDAREVVAVDPDANMVAEARRLAAAKNRQNIQWLQSRAEDIALGARSFRVATIGQAFHWMNRDDVLRKLAILIEDGGGLALVNPGKRRPQESWEPIANQTVARFLGPRTRHPQSNPQEPANEPSLRRSQYFSEFTAHEFPSTITRDINSIIRCVYSLSSSTKPYFGDNVEAFEAELSAALLTRNPAGVFYEQIETEVVIAHKKTL